MSKQIRRHVKQQSNGQQAILTRTAESVDESNTRESHVTDTVGGPDDLLRAHIETLNHFTLTITVLALRPQIYSRPTLAYSHTPSPLSTHFAWLVE